ncbi:hypothetical protein K493DRAFT_377262 [Basidiobolus meristosporus CBS 931.73]|uniref:Arrestin C-terminal-like domain-containing protein n=1 Tax=Basidiobolus meristosporus CBS 931.73 TaxID=1314790 RepID=A0A1Y1Y2J3_9FUNG|nr:hypothetical protein K493DRAFT_377262 [Basidiobolus meristosporus CBS 931.73]|eukprot:ORX92227.1 hypothetical protein K493DRAFT_377262 [Basidiobolus meristosporus CBS 931.73]
MEIIPSEDQITLHGPPTESGGVVLEGKVAIYILEETKVKSLSLKLTGKAKASWKCSKSYNGKTHVRHAKREIIKIVKPLLPLRSEPHILSPGKHEFVFEFPIEGSLPETVHVKNGCIQYTLKAIADRPFPKRKSTHRREIQIVRTSFPGSVSHLQPINVHDVWNDNIPYEISLPVKSFGLGDIIPVTIKLFPEVKDVAFKSISCHLKECVTYCKPESGRFKIERQWLHFSTDCESLSGIFEKTLHLPIPSESDSVHFDCCTELIKIEHKLKMRVEIESFEDGEKAFYVEFPIIIMPESNNDPDRSLPVYTAEWLPNPHGRRMSLPPSYDCAGSNQTAIMTSP